MMCINLRNIISSFYIKGMKKDQDQKNTENKTNQEIEMKEVSQKNDPLNTKKQENTTSNAASNTAKIENQNQKIEQHKVIDNRINVIELNKEIPMGQHTTTLAFMQTQFKHFGESLEKNGTLFSLINIIVYIWWKYAETSKSVNQDFELIHEYLDKVITSSKIQTNPITYNDVIIKTIPVLNLLRLEKKTIFRDILTTALKAKNQNIMHLPLFIPYMEYFNIYLHEKVIGLIELIFFILGMGPTQCTDLDKYDIFHEVTALYLSVFFELIRHINHLRDVDNTKGFKAWCGQCWTSLCCCFSCDCCKGTIKYKSKIQEQIMYYFYILSKACNDKKVKEIELHKICQLNIGLQTSGVLFDKDIEGAHRMIDLLIFIAAMLVYINLVHERKTHEQDKIKSFLNSQFQAILLLFQNDRLVNVIHMKEMKLFLEQFKIIYYAQGNVFQHKSFLEILTSSNEIVFTEALQALTNQEKLNNTEINGSAVLFLEYYLNNQHILDTMNETKIAALKNIAQKAVKEDQTLTKYYIACENKQEDFVDNQNRK